jgi:hypothetical protein
MSIKILDNQINKLGGKIIFIPENCDYLNGKALELVGCEIYCYNDLLENQITKTIYGVMFGSGTLSISGDSVKAHNTKIYCSGDLEVYAKALAAYCRKMCGQDEVEL